MMAFCVLLFVITLHKTPLSQETRVSVDVYWWKCAVVPLEAVWCLPLMGWVPYMLMLKPQFSLRAVSVYAWRKWSNTSIYLGVKWKIFVYMSLNNLLKREGVKRKKQDGVSQWTSVVYMIKYKKVLFSGDCESFNCYHKYSGLDNEIFQYMGTHT